MSDALAPGLASGLGERRLSPMAGGSTGAGRVEFSSSEDFGPVGVGDDIPDKMCSKLFDPLRSASSSDPDPDPDRLSLDISFDKFSAPLCVCSLCAAIASAARF